MPQFGSIAKLLLQYSICTMINMFWLFLDKPFSYTICDNKLNFQYLRSAKLRTSIMVKHLRHYLFTARHSETLRRVKAMLDQDPLRFSNKVLCVTCCTVFFVRSDEFSSIDNHCSPSLVAVTLNYNLFNNPSSAKFIFYLVLITQFSPYFNPFSTSSTHF